MSLPNLSQQVPNVKTASSVSLNFYSLYENEILLTSDSVGRLSEMQSLGVTLRKFPFLTEQSDVTHDTSDFSDSYASGNVKSQTGRRIGDRLCHAVRHRFLSVILIL